MSTTKKSGTKGQERSIVWRFFKKVIKSVGDGAEEISAVCQIEGCRTKRDANPATYKYKQGSSTSQMLRHLENEHYDVIGVNDHTGLMQSEVEHHLLKFLSNNKLPLSILNCPHLETLIQKRPKLYHKVTTERMKALIEEKTEEVKTKITKDVSSVSAFSNICDGWTSKGMRGLYNNSIMYLDEDMNLKNPTLTFKEFNDKHTGDNVVTT